jgi:Ca2+-binding RTX toxin-like protein
VLIIEAADLLAGGLVDGGAGIDTVKASSQVLGFDMGASNEVFNGSSSGDDVFSTGTQSVRLLGYDGSDTMSGGGGADQIYGMVGDDVLSGGLGHDLLSGGAGADVFVFNTALGAANVDRIQDFQVGVDRVALDSSVFAALGVGPLATEDFLKGVGLTSGAEIVYNTNNGKLYYDADGAGAGVGVEFAQLSNRAALTANDFDIV